MRVVEVPNGLDGKLIDEGNGPQHKSNSTSLFHPPQEDYKPDPDWATPIEFYGMVLDQYGNPVEGAEIVFEVNDMSQAGHTEYHRKSVGNGGFSISGIKGKGMGVYVAKHGYYQSRMAHQHFEYAGGAVANFVPNLNSRIIFYLHSKGVGEPLHQVKKALRLPKDGSPVAMHLQKNEQVVPEKADLVVQLWASNLTEPYARNFD